MASKFRAGLIPGPAVTWEGLLRPQQPLREGAQAGSEHLGLFPVPSGVTDGLMIAGQLPKGVQANDFLAVKEGRPCVCQDNSSPLLHNSPNSRLPPHQRHTTCLVSQPLTHLMHGLQEAQTDPRVSPDPVSSPLPPSSAPFRVGLSPSPFSSIKINIHLMGFP